MAGDIVSEIKQARRTSKAADLDVSDIAKKYIHLGADKDSVQIFLKNNKFSVHQVPSDSPASQTLLAIYSDRSIFNLISGDEIRIIIVLNGNKVYKVSGILILSTL